MVGILEARKHLTRAELDRMISEDHGVDSPWMDAARAHLDVCRRCRMSLLFGEARVSGSLSETNGVEPCPTDLQLQKAATGSIGAQTALNTIQHAMKCQTCAEKLKEYANVAANEPAVNVDKFKTSDHQWQKTFARQMAAYQKPIPKKQPWFHMAGWAFAALLLIGVIGWFVSQRDSVNKVNALVASAYSGSRTSDLRLAGAAFSEPSAQRGTASRTSQPLAEARASIERLRPKLQDTPEFLDAEARADLASNDVEGAYEKLKRANQQAPGTPSILTNLAIAECLLADSGQPERYQVAYDLLSQAIEKDGRNTVAIFNRAIVAERLRHYTSAVADWNRVLELEPEGPWSNEARKRKAADQTLLDHHTRAPAQSENSTEAAIEGPVLDLLTVSSDSTPTKLAHLADSLLENHQDPWLRDILSQRKPTEASAFSALANAHRENAASDHDHGLIDANLAIESFSRSGDRPALLRAKAERIYALHRSGHSRECVAASSELASEAARSHYWWIQGFATVENHVCTLMLGDLAGASKLLDASEAIAQAHSFKILAVRLIGMRAGLLDFTGNAREAWRLNLQGLDVFWQGYYPPIRAYQFYSDMVTLEQNAKYWRAALASNRECALMASRTQYRYAEAASYFGMGLAEHNLDHNAAAFTDFDKASQIFASMPATPTTQFYRIDAEVSIADLAQTAPLNSAERLESIRPQLKKFSSQTTNIYYFDALGRAWQRAGNPLKAEEAYRGAVKEFEESFAVDTDEQSRTQLMRRSSSPFRGLVTALIQQGKTNEALDVWEHWRGIDLARSSAHPSSETAALSSVAASAAHQQTFVSFFRMQDGLAIWTYDDRGVHFTKVNVDPQRLDHEVAAFIKMCGDPSSNVASLQASAANLYDWYLKPIEGYLSTERTLIIFPEDVDWNLPFAALRSPNGHYIAEIYRLAQAPGLAEYTSSRPSLSIRNSDSALVVASPGANGQRLAALPETVEEAQAVSRLFTNSTLLSGRGASVDAVTSRLRGASVFHYGGHALVSTTSDALVLPSEDGKVVAFNPASLPQNTLRSLRLVVLAGCSTGREKNEMTPVESMSRQFVRAGVPAVVAAHWAVDSTATQTFMHEFYSDLLNGKSVSESVRQAGLDLLHNPRSSHPYYWAAFTTYGRG